jgi:hypothetical protein
MENREEQGLSPWRSVTTSDDFWDRGLEDNSQLPIFHIINTFTDFGIDNRGNVSLLEQRKTVTQFQVLGLGNSLELVNRIC